MVHRGCLAAAISLIVLVAVVLVTVGILNKTNEYEATNSPKLNETDSAFIDQFKNQFQKDELYPPFMKSDIYLLRWIRDSDYDLDKAAVKLKKSLEWRKQNGINTVIDGDYSDIFTSCPVYTDGHDRDGDPLVVFPYGTCKVRKVLMAGDMKRIHQMMYYLLENSLRSTRELEVATGRDVKAVGIVDFNGFSYLEHACLKCLPLLTHMLTIYENNYPDSIKSWYIINVPRLGQALLDMMMPLISQNTKNIIKVFGYNKAEWATELLKTISPDQLPQEIQHQLKSLNL